MAEFEPQRILAELNAAGVRFVLIGGVAGAVRGSSALTEDIDICYARDLENVEALVGVLRRLGATLRGVDREVLFRLDSKTIRQGDSFTFATAAGDFDILGTPSGTAGFDDLARAAEWMELGGFKVLTASLDDLIRMKRAAGRPKDLYQVEILAALRDEIGGEAG